MGLARTRRSSPTPPTGSGFAEPRSRSAPPPAATPVTAWSADTATHAVMLRVLPDYGAMSGVDFVPTPTPTLAEGELPSAVDSEAIPS